MPYETYLVYLLATLVVLVIPGPTILLVVSYGISEGRSSVLRTAPGVVLGDFTCMCCSLLGLGALLATSGTMFMVLKWIGAAYLVYLGLKMWRAKPDPVALIACSPDLPARERRRSGWSMFAHCYLVTATNPKGIIFFTAFLPQFLDHGQPFVGQMIVLGGTFLVLAFVNAISYGMLASGMRRFLGRTAVLRAAHRLGGSLLIGAGIMTATARRV